MATSAQPYLHTGAQRWLAWSVHVYTASGAVAAFAGVLAVIAGDYRTAFLWMMAATFVDATDGVLARDIVDYLTYVFLPVLLLYHAGDLPRGLAGLVTAGAILLSSAYGFASLDAKTEDQLFTGFPSYWNIVALYVHVAGLTAAVNTAILLVFVSLVFVRIGYVYPSRTPFLRGLTVVLGSIWAFMVLGIVLAIPNVPDWLWIGSLFFPVYYFMLSIALHVRGRKS
jgi:phosphatidylcholine synthase